MFTKARINLTVYYLTIIMFVSFLFSLLAYRGFVYEMWRGLSLQSGIPQSVIKDVRDRVENEPVPLGIFYGPARLGQIINEEIYDEAKRRVMKTLAYINLAVLVTSGIGGYILAGRTLQPIEQVLEEQKRFVSDASHELRTPLTSLKTEIEVALMDKKLTLGSARKVLKSNLEDVDKMQSLSSYLLTLTRYEKGVTVGNELIDLKDVVQHSLKKFGKLINLKKIKVVSEFKEAKIVGSSIGISELVSILLDNAVKYTAFGGSIYVQTFKNSRNSVMIVKDTGIGISSLDLPHIFDRFYRADQSRSKAKVSGFGLGLAIAKKIIDNHHGSVKVESNLGIGTKFTVKFPRSS